MFNLVRRKGTYTRDYAALGTKGGQVSWLEGAGRLSFYEDEGNPGDNVFFLTVFTLQKLSDGRSPAVMSSHVWWAGVKDTAGKEIFLPTQRIGGCR
jgi:hypothetical protein